MLFSDKPILMAKSEELVEPTKEFKNVITDFVTTECLKTPEQQKKFANLIHIYFTSNCFLLQTNVPSFSLPHTETQYFPTIDEVLKST